MSAREGKPTPTPTRLAEARHSASSRYQESVWHPLVGVPRAAAFSPLRRRQTLQPSRFLFDCIPMPQSGQRILSPGSKRLAFSITVCSASHAKPSASSSVLARPERFHRPAECRWRAEKLDSCPGAAMEGVTNQKLQQLSGWGLQPSQPNTASKSAVVRWALSWLRLRLLDVAIKHSASSGSERQKHHASAPGSYSFTKSTSSSWFLSTAMALGHEQGTSCIKIRGCSVRPRENGARNGARGATLAWQGAFQPGSGSREIRYH